MCGPAPVPGRGYGHCPLQIHLSHYFAPPRSSSVILTACGPLEPSINSLNIL